MKRVHILRLALLLVTVALSGASLWAFPVNIDARALTNTQFFIQDITPPVVVFPVFDATVVQALDLDAGAYIFQPGSGNVMSCTLFVTAMGQWNYDPACEPFLSGAGTDTLVLDGYPVFLDATNLSTTGIVVQNLFVSPPVLDSTSLISMQLVPAPNYLIQPGSGVVSPFVWGVDLDGHVTYGMAFDGFAAGRGTDTLVLLGYTIHIDATALTPDQFVLTNLFGLNFPHHDANVVQTFTLLPMANHYLFQIGSGGAKIATFTWGIDLDGHITYDAAFDAYLSGRGTDTLTINGYPVEVDATALAPGSFFLLEVFGGGPFDESVVQPFTLIPVGAYRFFDPPINFVMVLQENGTWNYDPALDACVFGRNTARLTVLCDPADPPTPEELIAALQQMIAGLPASAFRNGNANLANALINKLNAVLAQIAAARAETDPAVQDQLFQDAIDKLTNDLLAKTNGCAAMGVPDAND